MAERRGLLALCGRPPAVESLCAGNGPTGRAAERFEHRDGYRYQTFATNTPAGGGPIPFLEARHRAHARVEDRIRCAKDSGLGRLPSRELAINTAWLELVLAAADLTAWLQTAVLAGQPDLARAEPKALRYRLLHTAARITRGGRRIFLNLARAWPWTTAIINAFARLRLVPVPT